MMKLYKKLNTVLADNGYIFVAIRIVVYFPRSFCRGLSSHTVPLHLHLKLNLNDLVKQAEEEKKLHQDKYNAEIELLESDGQDLRHEADALEKQIGEIENELTRER